jgi:hypothetical protein
MRAPMSSNPRRIGSRRLEIERHMVGMCLGDTPATLETIFLPWNVTEFSVYCITNTL